MGYITHCETVSPLKNIFLFSLVFTFQSMLCPILSLIVAEYFTSLDSREKTQIHCPGKRIFGYSTKYAKL